MRSVLYTGAFRFPDGDAAAFRVYSVGKLFEEAGYSVAFAGWEKSPDEQYKYKGYDCYPQAEFRERQRSLVGRLFGFMFRGIKTLKWFSRNRRFDIVVAYNPPAIFSFLLFVMCWKWKVHLILDSTEWYDGDHLPGGRFGPAAIENWIRMRLVYPLFRNIICISRFLEHHFAGRNIINIPPLMNGTAITAEKPPLNSRVVFVYAGDAGKKDRLLSFIKALPRMQELLQREVLLQIAGQNWDALRLMLNNEGIDSAVFAPFIRCHGRVSREEVNELYEQSHFSVFFREDKRYAYAGFPTKAMESWANGCPIITNPIGDVSVLAQDMEDAIIVNESDIENQLPISLRIIIDSDRYTKMSANCREKANRQFSIAAYRAEFARFVGRI